MLEAIPLVSVFQGRIHSVPQTVNQHSHDVAASHLVWKLAQGKHITWRGGGDDWSRPEKSRKRVGGVLRWWVVLVS